DVLHHAGCPRIGYEHTGDEKSITVAADRAPRSGSKKSATSQSENGAGKARREHDHGADDPPEGRIGEPSRQDDPSADERSGIPNGVSHRVTAALRLVQVDQQEEAGQHQQAETREPRTTGHEFPDELLRFEVGHGRSSRTKYANKNRMPSTETTRACLT